ncbi:uncharacterized protein LOC123877495 [Maniola jurtina]|uniref:uncharacterized protein LOC123877495 n=1 Tax=Maniola jurtina TaxID=191418 RepID=UPI001E68CC16|nr:uncharacterized protein LOC123877495 [Maniola jurtina]
MGEGIIIFGLWYLAIAYNYYIVNSDRNKPDDKEANKNYEPTYVQPLRTVRDDKKKIELTKDPPAVDQIEAKARVLEEPVKIEPIVETIVEPMMDPKDEDDSAGEFMHEEIEED